MKRRTLDVLFSAGGLAFAVLFLILGLVLTNQANFAESYVKRELAAQAISFPAEYGRGETDVEGSGCLLKYQDSDADPAVTSDNAILDTGKKAECYARYYIATHMVHSTEDAGYPGATYASLGGVTRGIQGEIDAATEAGEDTAALEEKLAVANGLRETMFKGETLRGLLLTTYGFSVFGERASQAATVCYIAAVLLFLLSIAGFIHALVTPKNKEVLPHVQPTTTA